LGWYLSNLSKIAKLTNSAQDAEGNQRDSWGTTTIRATDLDVSPDMTKVVTVGIIPNPSPPSSAGASPAPGTCGDSIFQPPQSQPHAPGCTSRAENGMVVYDIITKETIACVPINLDLTTISDARSVDRSLKLDGEITSVRVSRDSRYALINHSPDVGLCLLLATRLLI